MIKNNFAVSFLLSNFVVVMLTAVSFSQEFDWDEDFVQARSSNQTQDYSDNGLPGVNKDPFAARSRPVYCSGTSLTEALSGGLPDPTNCPRNSQTIFQLQTDAFSGSPK